MAPETETLLRDPRDNPAENQLQTKAAEARPASKRAFRLTMIGFWVFGAGGMWAWIVFQAIDWISQAETILLQSPVAQEPFW
jgi:hypothetical protein